MIKAVFIDIDNTLLSFSGYVKETMKKGFAHFGLKKYEPWMFDAFEKVNNALWRQIEKGEITFEELSRVRWNRAFKAIGIDFDGPVFEKYFRANLNNSAVPIPHAHDMLGHLFPKYVLCAASNGPADQQKHRLKIGDMAGFFRFCFISEEAGAQKPTKEFFDYCFGQMKSSGLDIRPEETMIIGDSMTSDISGGAEYGMHTCLFTGAHNDPPASTDGAEFVVSSLDEIKNIL